MSSVSAVPVHARFLGGEGKPPMVIVHGLLGSSRNWLTAGKVFTEHYAVYLLDLRNHGESPWSDVMNFEALAADLQAWLDKEDLHDIILMGHSLGGKTAMTYACRHPQRIKRLVVVDIAPKQNHNRWVDEFQLMQQIDLDHLKNRREAEDFLEQHGVAGWAFRKFLVSNLVHTDDGKFRWTANIPVLGRALPDLFQKNLLDDDYCRIPLLVIRGERSNFVSLADEEAFRKHFADFKIVTVSNAGHNVHVEHFEGFRKCLYDWLQLE
ncbi:MAG: alpha/beta fold hydrolase [Opitutales bacterium]|nr:alpha/beta fold hydrolase [Opitutales bacterium]